jgi:hypothetical protein
MSLNWRRIKINYVCGEREYSLNFDACFQVSVEFLLAASAPRPFVVPESRRTRNHILLSHDPLRWWLDWLAVKLLLVSPAQWFLVAVPMPTFYCLTALGALRLTPLTTGIRVNNNYEFSSYRTETIMSFGPISMQRPKYTHATIERVLQ